MRFGSGLGSGRTWKRTVTMAAVAAALGLWMSEAHAGDPPIGKKLEREMRVMTRVIDDALVDSPNLLVPNTEPTGGIYVDGVGAVFSFKATLVRENFDSWNWMGARDVHVKRHGSRITIFHDDDDDWDEWEDEDDDLTAEERKKLRGSSRKAREKSLDRRFLRGKEELLDVMLEAGDILASLKDSEQVILAASFHESDYLDDKDISQVIMKARVSDLRAHANGTLNREAALTKIQVVEN